MGGDVGEIGFDVFEQRGAIEVRFVELGALSIGEPMIVDGVNEKGVAEHDVGHASHGAVLVFLGDADGAPEASCAGGVVVPDRGGVGDVGGDQVEVLGP